MVTKLALCFSAALLLASCGDGDRSSRPTLATGPVNCKSPVSGQDVPKAVAIEQATRHNARVLALGDSQSIIVTVDCGDDIAVVPPVVVVP